MPSRMSGSHFCISFFSGILCPQVLTFLLVALNFNLCLFMSVVFFFSHLILPNSLWPHGLQHTRFPCILHHLPDLALAHVHWVSDAIQPSRSLPSSFPPVFSLFQHQGLFQWVSSSHQVAKVLELQLQSFQWIQGWFPLGLTAVQGTLKSSLAPQFESIYSLCLRECLKL